MVSRCYETETRPITFDEIWEVTRSGGHGLKEKITQIRSRYEMEKDITGGDALKAKKAVADLKQELPGFLPSGAFSKRESTALVHYSGLLCADLDSLGERIQPVKEILKNLPFVRAIALSPSGDGLKVFFNVINDPARHEDSFRSIKENMLGLDIEIDEKCKDPCRICFFTYDPDLWLREENNEILLPADPLPRAKPVLTSADVNSTVREQIAFRLLGELRPAPEKGGFFVNCPGFGFHTNKSGDKHTILYLDTVPTLSCQHDSCSHVVEAFNKVLRSEIGKAEFAPSDNGERPARLKVKAEPDESLSKQWADALVTSTVTITTLHGLTLRPRKPLLGKDPAWFCEGDLGIIFGPRGVAKTFFGAAISQALSTGGMIGEWKTPSPVKVLYVDAEMPADMMRTRFEALAAVNDNIELLNHELLFDRTNMTMNLTRPEFQKAVMEYCVKGEHKVVILDNLSTLGIGMKENDSSDWDLINPWLLDMRRRQISVIILHHAGRSGEMRGTSRREDNVFWIISLRDRRKEEETTKGAKFVSTFSKPSRNTPEVIPDYEWHFTPDETTGLITIHWKRAHSLHSFLEILRGGVVKPTEIARVMNLPDYTISRLAHKAQKLGWMEKRARGEYELTTAGEIAIDEEEV
jgi:putative DNA primase/helicase